MILRLDREDRDPREQLEHEGADIGLDQPAARAPASGGPGRPPPSPVRTSALEGEWLVQRLSGLLPPGGLRKKIGRRTGSTLLGRLPIALFRVRGDSLQYRLFPVRDELSPGDDGTWVGRGLILGREFCRFRLVRASGPGER